jgi:hypothetical protein
MLNIERNLSIVVIHGSAVFMSLVGLDAKDIIGSNEELHFNGLGAVLVDGSHRSFDSLRRATASRELPDGWLYGSRSGSGHRRRCAG